MITAQIEITGTMPLLMHADNIDFADRMDGWKNIPENKAKSKAGDDRTPPWRWIGCLNYDDPKTGVVTIPSEYVMTCIRQGAAQVPKGKKNATFKSQSQSGLICAELHWPMSVDGRLIKMEDIRACEKLTTFKENQDLALDLGFSLLVKRATVGTSKHIRVRPLFANWSVSGKIHITDEEITTETLLQILTLAGQFKGLGDWRPGGKTPGVFGTFTAKVHEISG